MNALATSGVETVIMHISTEADSLNVGILQATLRQQPAICQPKVYVMPTLHGIRDTLSTERIYFFHRKVRFSESLHDFFPYLEAIESDARTNNSTNIGRNGSKAGGHFSNSLCCNAQDRAAPSGMYGAYSWAYGIVKKHGNAVSRARPNGNAGHIGHQGIDALQILTGERWRINVCNFVAMYLMGLDNREGELCPTRRGKGRHSRPKIII